jgi:3-isopropylmalate dehydrogenase
MIALGNQPGCVECSTEDNRPWSDCIFQHRCEAGIRPARAVIGVLEGEGVGPEVIRSALQVLSAVESLGRHKFQVARGGPIGRAAERRCGAALSEAVIDFCRDVFAQGGAVLTGPGGGRYVYDLRRRFQLFCKLSPLKACSHLAGAIHLKPEHLESVDILVVRENMAGVYQGQWKETRDAAAGRTAEHSFSYCEADVRRILDVAASLALRRRGQMAVVYKNSGIPAISSLWRDCAGEAAGAAGVELQVLDVDYAAYRLLQSPQQFDVLVAPNLFGDVLGDLGAVLLGSRALAYAGSFSAAGAAVFQTNHGAAYDLAGTDRANPVGQILSLAMLLRESLGLADEAALVEDAVAQVWSEGWRTEDLIEPGCSQVGTREMGNLVADAVIRLAS